MDKAKFKFKKTYIIIAISVLAVVSLLIVVTKIVFPEFQKSCHQMWCMENMSLLRYPLVQYAQDNAGQYPVNIGWCDFALSQDTGIETLKCKVAKEGPSTYAMNRYVTDKEAKLPGDMVLLFESKPGWNQVGGPEMLNTENHQGEGCTILFVDGHVEFVKTEELEN